MIYVVMKHGYYDDDAHEPVFASTNKETALNRQKTLERRREVAAVFSKKLFDYIYSADYKYPPHPNVSSYGLNLKTGVLVPDGNGMRLIHPLEAEWNQQCKDINEKRNKATNAKMKKLKAECT